MANQEEYMYPGELSKDAARRKFLEEWKKKDGHNYAGTLSISKIMRDGKELWLVNAQPVVWHSGDER